MPAPHTPDVRLAANPDAGTPYEFRAEIARGGMGSILEAADCKLGRTVAVKIMLAEMKADAEQRQRFIHEAAVLATLEHPNIVPIHDLGRDAEGQLYYTMKLVRGRTLQNILTALHDGEADALRDWPLTHLLTVFRKICDALAFAHSRGIIHRDLKPENIMVGEFGEVLVMDWGLAKALERSADTPVRFGEERGDFAMPEKSGQECPRPLDADSTETLPSSASDTQRKAALRQLAAGSSLGMTLEGSVMGTPQYMSPEQAQGRIAEMDARSDIFSLGGILYAILTLRPPVEGATLDEVLQKVISGSITALNSPTKQGTAVFNRLSSSIPASLASVTMKALSLDKAQRYQSVAALSADIEAYQNGFATSAEHAGTWKRLTLLVKRHKAASVGMAAVLLIGTTFGTKAVVEGRRAEQALADLKQNAPAMLALAESEAVAQHHESALEKTEATLRLDPDLLPAYWRRAWGLIALGRFSDAATALRVASERDPANAKTLGAILPHIDKIAAISVEADRYAPDVLTPVFEFLESHGARGEAGALIAHLRLTNDRRFAIAKERLTALGGSLAGLSQDSSGLIQLNFASAKLKTLDQVRGIPCDILIAAHAGFESIEPLRGLRLIKINLDGSRFTDLTPLRGMALVDLNLYGNPGCNDLSPLAGMPLRKLSLFGCTAVVDLSPLRGMPLDELILDGTRADDLRPLAGMPMRRLNLGVVRDLRSLSGMPLEALTINAGLADDDLTPLAGLPLKSLNAWNLKLKDLTPLLRVPTLERLACGSAPEVLAALRQHPRLAFINYKMKGYRPVAEVWAELDAQMAADMSLQIAKEKKIADELAQIQAALSALGFDGTIKESRPWGRHLDLNGRPISDVTPLRPLPIAALWLYKTKVTDLAPLRGMRLKEISIDATAVADVSPLLDMPVLEAAMIPRSAANIEVLRRHPTLKYLGWEGDYDAVARHSMLTTALFWKRYDEQKAAAKK